MVWDNASWHFSKEVRTWIKAHNRKVRQTGQSVRIVACYLPAKSPWLNPIEPHWVHGKRDVSSPLVCSRLSNRRTECAATLVASMKRTWRLPIIRRDDALANAAAVASRT